MNLILVVGPSGSGKDTIINYVASRLPVKKVRRVITRPGNKFEDFESVTPEEFGKMKFFAKWEAHGKKYGIPLLGEGTHILNVSRTVANELKEKYGAFIIELKTNKEILRERLIRRGRDPPDEIRKRLEREVPVESDFCVDTSNPDASIAGEKVVNYIKEKLLI